MEAEQTTGSFTSVGAVSLDVSQRLRPAIVEDVESLLGGRTRDIRLNGELDRLFRERSWRQTAKIIRAWMIWVIVLDVLTLGLNAILLPIQIVALMLPPASILPPAALFTAIVFRKPRVCISQICKPNSITQFKQKSLLSEDGRGASRHKGCSHSACKK